MYAIYTYIYSLKVRMSLLRIGAATPSSLCERPGKPVHARVGDEDQAAMRRCETQQSSAALTLGEFCYR